MKFLFIGGFADGQYIDLGAEFSEGHLWTPLSTYAVLEPLDESVASVDLSQVAPVNAVDDVHHYRRHLLHDHTRRFYVFIHDAIPDNKILYHYERL